MKAFLSHSSRDKGFVGEVYKSLGMINAELDSDTFDRGLLNVEAIQAALKRSSLFVLFLSESSLASKIVRYEALLAQELVARGVFDQFLVVCLDEHAFSSADENWKGFNFVRRAVSAQSIARQIQARLTVNSAKGKAAVQPFVGRLKEQHDTKEALASAGAKTRAIYVSGNLGIGRRSFAKRIFQDRYPAINPVFPELRVEDIDGSLEVYRKLNELVTPLSTLAAYRARIAGFSIANEDQRAVLIAQLLSKLLDARESLFLIDNGGLLTDEGRLQPHFKRILESIENQTYPPIVMVAERMVPRRYRNEVPYVIFCPLPSLSEDELKQLLKFQLQDASLSYSDNEIEDLVELSAGHPFNAQMLVGMAKESTLKVFLADPSDFNQWKQRQGTAYLKKLTFSPEETRILAGLRDFRALDFDTLVLLADVTLPDVGKAVNRLLELHIVEATGEAIQISPPLRAAIERDPRFAISGEARRSMLEVVSGILRTDNDGTELPISMIDAAILAALQSNREIPSAFSSLLFPSHYVWLARRRYHEKDYRNCIKLARTSLDGAARLSPAGQIEACRYLCLAAAHLNDTESFEFGIAKLGANFGGDARAKSNFHFLKGFNARLSGNLPEAEKSMRASFDASPRNFQATRELAAICLLRSDLDSAEKYARIAFDIAPDNSFVLDMLLSVLLKLPKNGSSYSEEEVSSLFRKLEQVGEEDGRSFYATRRAEYELRNGNTSTACTLIDDAAKRTPSIFNVHALRAEIYLEHGNKTVARDEIKKMQDIVYKSTGAERFSNLRPLLDLEASYYVAIGDFASAKKIYQKKNVYTDEEATDAIKRIEVEQAFSSKRR